LLRPDLRVVVSHEETVSGLWGEHAGADSRCFRQANSRLCGSAMALLKRPACLILWE